MKIVVFASTPPPYHGQSKMIQFMLEGLEYGRGQTAVDKHSVPAQKPSGDLKFYHVNSRLSRDLADVGRVGWRKGFLLVTYCLQALWMRFRHGASVFYFVPAAPIRASLYRDWLVMLLCRHCFRQTLFHWHAVGLGEWVESRGTWWERRISHALLDRADLAIVLSDLNRADAERFRPQRVAVVPNGIPDPCPDYAQRIGPLRARRLEHRRRLLAGRPLESCGSDIDEMDVTTVNVLFLAHCTREKGLFDAIEGTRLANKHLAAQTFGMRLKLWVVGEFLNPAERLELERILAESAARSWVEYKGFHAGAEKEAALEQADVFCFPTYYASEGQPLNLLEAMAHGLPILTTRWRSIPELLPASYPGLVEPRHPEQVAAALLALMVESGAPLREAFLGGFLLESHITALTSALLGLNHG